jgi:hypothetical protein
MTTGMYLWKEEVKEVAQVYCTSITSRPFLISDDTTWRYSQASLTETLVAKWRQRPHLLAAAHKLILEDAAEILDEENQKEDHRDDISTGLSPQAQRSERARPQGRSGGSRTVSGS